MVRHADFAALRIHGVRLRSSTLRARFVPRDGTAVPTLRLAFAIGRSFGPAVQRNRARRRLRHALVVAADRLEDANRGMPEGDLLLSCSPRVLDLAYSSLVNECAVLLAEAALRQSTNARPCPDVR
ncbi:MAG: ribonuclease P protein component [Actinomycetota bacterium]|nr:ribonuclease P protein component [Actinomycetota bacterium]